MLDLGFFVIVVVVFWGAGLNSSQRDCLIISSAMDPKSVQLEEGEQQGSSDNRILRIILR